MYVKFLINSKVYNLVLNILKKTNKHLIRTGSSAHHGDLLVSQERAKATCKAARAGSTFKLNIQIIGRLRGFGVLGLMPWT